MSLRSWLKPAGKTMMSRGEEEIGGGGVGSAGAGAAQ